MHILKGDVRQSTTGFTVYTDDVFMMDSQWGYTEGEQLVTYMSSPQLDDKYYSVYGGNVSNEKALEIASKYQINVYTAAGQEIKDWYLSAAEYKGNTMHFYLDGLTTKHPGYYVKITDNGKAGVLSYNKKQTYYGSGANVSDGELQSGVTAN